MGALKTSIAIVVGLVLVAGSVGEGFPVERFIIVASTTSTQNSGFYDELLPAFSNHTGIDVRVVAVGTGQAIKLAKRGDADVLLVHHKSSEEKFIAEGYGVERFDVMYNDFVIIGPTSDLAGIGGMKNVNSALGKIARSQSLFVSRGDDSGTHKKELSLWRDAGIDILSDSSSWYRETGSGMGATLNVANGIGAYSLTDRATWLKFSNKSDLRLLVENDPRLHNQYGVILVNSELHPHIKAKDGQAFIDWITSDEGQKVINAFRLEGQQAFFANAMK